MSGLWSETAAWVTDPDTLNELAPKGRLRAAIAVGSARSALWATRDGRGRPSGVTVQIAESFAAMAGLPLELVALASSAAVVASAQDDIWDVAFAPVDDERKKHVDFGPDYYRGESTCLVRAQGPRSLDDLDARGVAIAGVRDTATLRSARRAFPAATILEADALEDAASSFSSGEAQALALGREALMSLLDRFPGARLLDGAFHATGTAVAVRKGRTRALGAATAMIEDMKADGTLRRIFDRCGLEHAAVAPPGAHS